RRKIREHAAAVGRLPPEEVEWQFVRLVPCQLVRDEEVHSGLLVNLRKLPAEAERIRIPANANIHSVVLLIPAFADQQLTNDGFSVREVEISFHPHAADNLPAAFLDALLDLIIE